VRQGRAETVEVSVGRILPAGRQVFKPRGLKEGEARSEVSEKIAILQWAKR